MTRRFLEHIRIEHFGALSQCDIGPLGEGLNIVYGPNEAGKTTIASFVGGVLFGWEEARGVRNTYRPADAERSGSLLFAGDGGALVSRSRNEDGLQGDTSVVSDVDSATYRTMFSLTSDELRSLQNSSDVTARLLTAGSGTGSSPAAAFVEIEQRIAGLMASNPDDPDSIVQLISASEEARGKVRDARAVDELRRQEDAELRELEQTRAATSARIDATNREIELLSAERARLAGIDAQMSERRSEIAKMRQDEREIRPQDEPDTDIDERLLDLDASAEREVRDRLDELEAARDKAARALDVARENSAASTAAYEAFMEMGAADAQGPSRKNRAGRAAVSVLLPVAFMAIGVPVFMHGREINSLSFTTLGIALIVFAFLLATAAFVVLFRPDKSVEALEGRRQDAQWVMLQDKKKLDSSLEAKDRAEADIASYLESVGLGRAQGSIRHARAQLDEAHAERSRRELLRQRRSALEVREKSARQAISALSAERAGVEKRCGLEAGESVQSLDKRLERLAVQRDGLMQALDEMNVRCGELSQKLATARFDRSFDTAKYDYQRLCCRLRERKEELVELLLARRMLEKSIAAWESLSQPEVYREASRLLQRITDGAWLGVSMTADGKLLAHDRDGAYREVRHLSLGTCQQLYLALRIAMLICASDVGRCIPVMADDILVNFDSARRRGAAAVLAELATRRQVILFTCHEETVEALRAEQPDCTCFELQVR